MFSVTNIACSTIGLLTLNMLNGIIIGTTSTLQSIYYMLPSNSSSLNNYKNQIESLDIEFKLKIVKHYCCYLIIIYKMIIYNNII